MANKYLVSIETVKIKDFIFSSNKLKVIRGASYLLDYLNQKVVPEVLKDNNIGGKEILYVGAGNAKFSVENEEKAVSIINEIKGKYKKYAPNAKLVGEYVEIDNNMKIWDGIEKLAEKTAQKKSEGFSTINIDLPFIKKCDICNNNSVEIVESDRESYKKLLEEYNELYNGNKRLEEVIGKTTNDGICRECFAKLVSSSYLKGDNAEVGFYHSVKKLENFEFGNEISDYSSDKSFIGFVYADGDGLGDFLKNVGTNFKNNDSDESSEKYIEFMGEFSEKLDEITKNSLLETLEELKEKYKDKDGKILYGEFLIVGGDDICGIFPADLALEISIIMQKKFEDKMAKYELDVNKKYSNFGFSIRNGHNNITISSGVIIAKDKTPLHYLFDLSLGMQKSAKAKRIEDKKIKPKDEINHGYIDFQVIGSEGTVNISEFRKGIENLVERPYCVTVNNEQEKIGTIDELIELIHELKEVKFPKNKLRKFYELKLEDKKIENLFEFMNLVGRLDEKSRGVVVKNWVDIENIDNLEFKEMLNNIFDILEIYSFVGGKNNEDKL